jgi:hypothetical protein
MFCLGTNNNYELLQKDDIPGRATLVNSRYIGNNQTKTNRYYLRKGIKKRIDETISSHMYTVLILRFS